MQGSVACYLTAALCAFELVELSVRITHAELKLKVEELVKRQSVAVSHSGSGKITLIAVLCKWCEIVPEDFDIVREESYVINSAMKMQTNEMACHAVAEPVPYFRLHVCVLVNVVISWERPCIVVYRYVERPSRRKSYFGSKVDRCSCIIQ